MITHQCQNCVDLATQLQIKSGECEGADALHEAEKQMHERTTDELRIARANNAQMCKDFDRRNELVESLESKVADLDGALARLGEDWAKQHVALIEKRGKVAKLEAEQMESRKTVVLATFTESLLLALLWHHQGGSSPVGQPIRKILGMGPYDQLTSDQIIKAKLVNRVDTIPNIASPARQQNLEATCLSFWGLSE